MAAWFKQTDLFVEINRDHSAWSFPLETLIFAVFFLAFFSVIRCSLMLVPLINAPTAIMQTSRRSWIGMISALILVVIFALVTGRWLYSGIVVVIGIIVWIPFYLSAKPRNIEHVEPISETIDHQLTEESEKDERK